LLRSEEQIDQRSFVDDIGAMDEQLYDRARGNWRIPDGLFPGRQNSVWMFAAGDGIGRGLRWNRARLARWRGTRGQGAKDGAGVELWLGMDVAARLDDRLGMEVLTWLDCGLGGDVAANAGSNVGGADGPAQQAHKLQVQRGGDEVDAGFEAHARSEANQDAGRAPAPEGRGRKCRKQRENLLCAI